MAIVYPDSENISVVHDLITTVWTVSACFATGTVNTFHTVDPPASTAPNPKLFILLAFDARSS